MATARQKEAARRNIAKPRQLQSARARGENIPRRSDGMSTAQEDSLADKDFAFPKERKEPLTDARHVRNAIARFNQVAGVSDAETGRGSGSSPRPSATTSRCPLPAGGTCRRRQGPQTLTAWPVADSLASDPRQPRPVTGDLGSRRSLRCPPGTGCYQAVSPPHRSLR